MGSGTGDVPASTSTGAFLLAIAGTASFSVAISIRSTGFSTIYWIDKLRLDHSTGRTKDFSIWIDQTDKWTISRF